MLDVDIIALLAKHLLHLVERLVGCPHCLVKGDIPWGSKKGVPIDDLMLHDVVMSNSQGRGCTHLGSRG
jgi:hypothetical protein